VPAQKVEGREESGAFLQKSAQKTLMNLGLGLWPRQSPRPRLSEVFWFFFSKKNCF
jgi:hypothetical protein